MEFALTQAAWIGLKGAVVYQYNQAQNAEHAKQAQWCFEQTIKRCVGYLGDADTAALAACSKTTRKCVWEAVDQSCGSKPMPIDASLHLLAQKVCTVNKMTKPMMKSAGNMWSSWTTGITATLTEIDEAISIGPDTGDMLSDDDVASIDAGPDGADIEYHFRNSCAGAAHERSSFVTSGVLLF